MKGRAFIDLLRREADAQQTVERFDEAAKFDLLADAVEEADGSFRDLIESECPFVEAEGAVVEGDGWWDTRQIIDGVGGSFMPDPAGKCGFSIGVALSYLDRRGLIERKEGEPHMVRFVEGA